MAKIPGLNISAPVVPSQDSDTYPSHRAIYGHGGWREVASIADRDAIPAARREAGMAVYITAEHTLYVLNDDLTTWTEFKSKSSDGIRAIGDLTNCTPLYDGEIVEYIGITDQNYTNGYFYKDTDTSGVRFNPNKININLADFQTFVEANLQPGEEGPVTQGLMYYLTDGTESAWNFMGRDELGRLICIYSGYQADFEAYGFSFTGPFENEDQFTYTVSEESRAWERVNLQPSLVDNITIIKDADEVITTIGVKTKTDTVMYDWIGTKAQWQAGRQAGTIPDSWICWITDDEEEPTGIANLAQVASSGSYNDLVNKPAYILPDLPADKNVKDYTLKWDHTLQALVWEAIS